MGGACTAGQPVVCTALDQCHVVGTCDPVSGVCSNPTQADGTACDDTNPCTVNDQCTAGACGGSPQTCNPSDECHTAGVCDMSNGTCTNPEQPDGTPCTDGTCQGGTCIPQAMDAGVDSGMDMDASMAVDADMDAGDMDAAVVMDAGANDAAQPVDAALPVDASTPIDAALPVDAAQPVDAAEPIDATPIADATSPPALRDATFGGDADASDEQPASQDSGCGCKTAGSSSTTPIGAFALIALGAALAVRRRKGRVSTRG
jgi:MYXO-CTERM domain-containing protein